MSTISSPRTRLIALVEILTIYSDEFNIISSDKILEKLGEYGHQINKRVLMEDIKALKDSGFNVISVSSPKKGFYLAKPFDPKTLHIIQKALYSSPLVTESEIEYTRNSIENSFGGMTLRQMVDTTIDISQKQNYESISPDNVYILRKAITDNKQVMLTVSVIEPGDTFSPSRVNKALVVNPYLIGIANSGVSLLFTCSSTPSKPEYIRIRRIVSVKPLDCVQNRKKSFDPAECTGHFGKVPPFSATIKKRCLIFKLKNKDIEYIDHILELPIEYRKAEQEGYCYARVNAVFNGRLAGCLLHLRDKIELIEPKTLEEII